jgi:hypothetical protein
MFGRLLSFASFSSRSSRIRFKRFRSFESGCHEQRSKESPLPNPAFRSIW